MKEKSEKAGLKLNIQKTKIMTKDGEKMERVIDFILGASKMTANGDCSHEIKRCLLLGRKTMTNLGSVLIIRDIALPTKVCISQSYGFSSGHE